MDLDARTATEADIPLLVDILNEANRFKLAHSDTIWGTADWTAEEVRERLVRAPAYLFSIGGEVVGTISLQWQDETAWGVLGTDSQAGYIHRLAVKDGYHGRDIGGKIMDWAAQETAKNHRLFLRLDCPANNPGLCVYYEHHGFKKLQDRPIPAFGDYVAALYQRKV